jgi:hypothetical protein
MSLAHSEGVAPATSTPALSARERVLAKYNVKLPSRPVTSTARKPADDLPPAYSSAVGLPREPTPVSAGSPQSLDGSGSGTMSIKLVPGTTSAPPAVFEAKQRREQILAKYGLKSSEAIVRIEPALEPSPPPRIDVRI